MNDRSGIFSGTKTQLFAAISGSLFAISDGICYGWTSPIIPYLISERSHLKTTKYEAEWLETVLMIGSVIGIPVTIYLVDSIGRKKSMLFAAVVSLLCWITIALANSMVYIFVARFCFGVTANVAFVAAPMYVAEIADHKIRGFLSSIIYIMMLIGFVIVYSVGPFLPFYVTPAIASAVLIIELSTFTFMPESPYYLLYVNKFADAKKSLEYLRPGRFIEDEFEDIMNAVKRQKTEKGTLKDLFLVKNNRKAIVIITVLNLGQHLAAISVVLMNLHIILDEAGSMFMDSSLAAILFAVLMLMAAQVCCITVDRFGRKALLILSTVLTGLCLLALAVYFNLKILGYDVANVSWLPIVSVMVYALAFKLGLGIVPIVLTAEIFSTKIKVMGMTIGDAMYVIGSIISLQLYQWLTYCFGIHVPFYLFSFFCFGITFFTYFYIPETKGKTLEEIQFFLKGEEYPETRKLIENPPLIYSSITSSYDLKNVSG